MRWWDDLSERITLAHWMVENDRIEWPDVLDVIEKPAKFTLEYTDMRAAHALERMERNAA